MTPLPASTDTFFASAGRLDASQIDKQFTELVHEGRVTEVLNASPYIALVTNYTRQIVFGNRELQSFVGLEASEIIGLRTGELLGCTNAENNPGGCGTGKNCRFCGIVGVLLDSRETETRIVRESRMFIRQSEKIVAYDVKVTATPIQIGSELYLLVYFEDISSQKKRERLERTFFHDVMNSAGGVKNLAMYLAETGNENSKRIATLLVDQSSLLIEEIRSQRLLIDAESYNLAVNPVLTDSLILFTEARSAAESLIAAEGREIISIPDASTGNITVDPILVKRILLNMLKNALEATESGGSIRFTMITESGVIVFKVWNPTAMPEEVCRQVFQRSFSTKGPGRGIGTYSMRLIAEQYLDGTVSFSSDEFSGTEFTVRIPVPN
jgi:nitrogen-specific signal transduction histidine kinase